MKRPLYDSSRRRFRLCSNTCVYARFNESNFVSHPRQNAACSSSDKPLNSSVGNFPSILDIIVDLTLHDGHWNVGGDFVLNRTFESKMSIGRSQKRHVHSGPSVSVLFVSTTGASARPRGASARLVSQLCSVTNVLARPRVEQLFSALSLGV